MRRFTAWLPRRAEARGSACLENTERAPGYVFALRYRRLTAAYDALLSLTLREKQFKTRLVRELSPAPYARVLDLGCGTGTLAIMLKRACPEAIVMGLDGDPEILARARRKALAADAPIHFVEGLAHELKLEPGSLDAVVSSLLFQHLTTAQKHATLEAVRKALRPGGTLLLADWGAPHGPLMRGAFLAVQLLDGFETTGDNVRGALTAMIGAAGFANAREVHRERTLFGTLSFYRAEAPLAPSPV